jgi:hypothetical protein
MTQELTEVLLLIRHEPHRKPKIKGGQGKKSGLISLLTKVSQKLDGIHRQKGDLKNLAVIFFP